MTRYLIIGSGAAGISAAEAIRSVDRSGELVLIGDESHGYYSRPGLAYVLTKEIPPEQIFPFRESDFKRLNLKRIRSHVTELHPEQHRITVKTGQQLTYDRLLLALGASAANVNIPGADLEGVIKLDNLEDVYQIQRMARRGRKAVVVGGGITALEIVEGLRAHHVKVDYLLRGDRYWSGILDETESRIIANRLQEEGVRLHTHTELEEIIGQRGRVNSVRTRNGLTIKTNLVGIAIGVRPRIELPKKAGLRTERGILVNEYLQTSASDIYAAGDIAQVYDPSSGKYVIDSLWGPAREQGYTAGLNMAGKPTVYTKAVPINVTRLANLTTTIIGMVGRGVDPDLLGIARGDSETWRHLPDAIAAQSDFDVNRLRVLVGEKKLIGAIVMGDQTLSHPLYHLIARQVDIRPIRDRLLNPDLPLVEVLIDFWTQWTNQHAKQQGASTLV